MKRLLPDRFIVAVDFDGTITTEVDIGKELVLKEGCKETLALLSNLGVDFILWTCRSGPALDEALNFLDREGMLPMFKTVNAQLPEVVEKYAPFEARKIGADVYIDDKNLGLMKLFNINWPVIGSQIMLLMKEKTHV